MLKLTCLLAAAPLLMPQPVAAQTVDPVPLSSERRLSAEQIEAVLAEAARKREAGEAAIPPQPNARGAPPVQGEAGVSVGTGGHREVFGSAIYPMGDAGAAAISVDLGKRRDRR